MTRLGLTAEGVQVLESTFLHPTKPIFVTMTGDGQLIFPRDGEASREARRWLSEQSLLPLWLDESGNTIAPQRR